MRGFIITLRSPYFWVILFLLLVATYFQYSELVPRFPVRIGSFLGLEHYTVERLIFLAPAILAGIFFGLRAGLVCLAVALVAMLPRVFLMSAYIAEAAFEVGTVTVIGALTNWWLEARRREVGQREQALLKLETTRRELQSYIQSIRENEKRLSVLHSVTTVINESVTLEAVLNTAADTIKEAFGVDGILIFLLNERTGELEIKVYRGISDESACQVNGLKVGEGFSGWVAQTGEPYLIEDSSVDPRLSREAVRKEGIRSQFIVPLMSREKVVGTLSVMVRSVRHFTNYERELLMLVGTELGVAVEKVRLYEEWERVGRMFRELFEKAHDAIWVHDFDGKILAANQQDAELSGYKLEELIGDNVRKFLTPQGLELAREARQKLLAGEEVKQPYEQKIVRKDGTQAIVMLTTSVVNYEGVPAFQNIARDVTTERRLQENLRLYVHQSTRAYEEERKRIARELHDDSIQALIALSRRIDGLLSGGLKRGKTVRYLEETREGLDGILARIRRFVQDLRPPTLDYLGLLPALRELTSQLQQTGIQSGLRVTGAERHFKPEDGLLIYRIVQEALTNVWKHSEAKRAEVSVEFDIDKTTVTVSDDGKGFEIKEDSGFVQAGRIGLAGMQERAELLGANLVIQSKPGSGTKVILEIPEERWTG